MRGAEHFIRCLRASMTGRLMVRTLAGGELPASRAPMHYPSGLSPNGEWVVPVFTTVPGKGYAGLQITSEMAEPTHYRITDKPVEAA